MKEAKSLLLYRHGREGEARSGSNPSPLSFVGLGMFLDGPPNSGGLSITM